MTYWNDYEYNERYFVRFSDVDGNAWRISIQDPTFEGTATELTGGAFPIEWEGEGDEDQTEVVLGSTGSLRLVCLDGQESIFTPGSLLPEMINDRRVQLTRTIGSTETLIWQGFIKPDTYSQAWDATPYEIELPIVSVIAAMEYFLLPDDIAGTPFEDVTNVAGMLRAICITCGCDVRGIYTNKPVYEDFNGETHQITSGSSTYAAHWSQGVVSPYWFYDMNGGKMTVKTFKEVLETLCYPYGKLHEIQRGIAVMMRWQEDSGNDARIYELPVYDDYDSHVYSSEVRFADAGPIPNIDIADIDIAGTDNTLSLVSRPSRVGFSKKTNNDNTIFELTEDMIKPSLPIGDTNLQNDIYAFNDEDKNYYLYMIEKSYVDCDFGKNWDCINIEYPDDREKIFCRVVKASGSSNDVTYEKPIPLGFALKLGLNSLTELSFTLKKGVRSWYYASNLKLTIGYYQYFLGQTNPTSLQIRIYDLTNGKYLTYTNNTWSWSENSSSFSISSLYKSDENRILWFNEERLNGDTRHHILRFSMFEPSPSGGPQYRAITFKLEYEKTKAHQTAGVLATFAENIGNNGDTLEPGGSGEEISIAFETLCGNKNITINDNIRRPYNSFCDAQVYIDTENREKIEIDAAKCVPYTWAGSRYDFASGYIVVKDGSKIFLPVAVGMNPRMNTVKLTLVSTNVTA